MNSDTQIYNSIRKKPGIRISSEVVSVVNDDYVRLIPQDLTIKKGAKCAFA